MEEVKLEDQVIVLFLTRGMYEWSHPKIRILNPDRESSTIQAIIQTWSIGPINLIGHDIENRGDHHTGVLLLSSFYKKDSREIIVIDNVTVANSEVFTPALLRRIEFISHNASHEARWHTKGGFLPNRFHCTMVRDKILTAGVDHLKYDLVATLDRRGVPRPSWMDKDIRDQFHTHGGIFTPEQVLYNAGDSLVLPALYEAQERWAAKQGQQYLLNSLRARVIRPLAEAETTGFVHNNEKWLQIAKTAKDKADSIAAELDKILLERGVDILSINKDLGKQYVSRAKREQKDAERLVKLRETITRFEEKGKTELKAYKLAKEQLNKITSFLPKSLDPAHVVWGSSKQAIEVLTKLGIPLPIGKDPKTKRPKVSVGKQAMNDWFTNNPNHPDLDLMKKFRQYKDLMHNVNAFGEEWIKKYQRPHSGKVYTVFRQADTTTSRLSSGNVFEGYFNLQQIPSRNGPEYRACFGTDPGRGIITLDYTGCEIVCMISLSRDLDLKRISELPDQHSYMGTKCWRAVYQARYERTGDPKWLELAQTYEMKNEGEGKKMRTKFKESGVFPVIYGVHPPKVASIQGFTIPDAEIFIKTIEGEMPNVVSFVKGKAAQALEDGYVVHNERARSRRWFWPVIQEQLDGIELTRSQRIEIESAARNTCIQGTNVDIVVEAMCMIDLWKRLFNVDIRLLGQVHDELIYDCPTDQLEWTRGKLVKLMERAAQNYLIPEISMKVDSHIADHWVK